MEEAIESLKNKLVKVLYKDGEEFRSIRGNLISYSIDFVKIQTLSNEMLINRTQIIKIQAELEVLK